MLRRVRSHELAPGHPTARVGRSQIRRSKADATVVAETTTPRPFGSPTMH
jgi:hypothetical protein